jgi:hypothetical protein
MTDPAGFFSRVLTILRQKSLPIVLLVLGGEAAIWLSGKASLGTLILLAVLGVLGASLAAVVRALRDDEKK